MNKRIRINTSVVELDGENINVYRNGVQLKHILVEKENALDIFERECTVEVLHHIHK